MQDSIPLHKRLGARFATVIFLLLVLPLIILYVFIAASSSAVMMDLAREDLTERAAFAGADIDRFIQERVLDTRIISQADVLEGEDNQRIIQYIEELLIETPYVSDIDVIDENGIFLTPVGREQALGRSFIEMFPDSIPAWEAARRAEQGNVFVWETPNSQGGISLIFMAPITDDANTAVLKTLALEVTLDVVEQIVSQFDSQVDGGKYVYIVDKQGHIIVSTDPIANVRELHPDFELNGGLINRIASQRQAGNVSYIDARGDSVIAGYSDMSEFGMNQGLDWTIMAVTPMSQVTGRFQTLRTTIAVSMGLISLLMVGGALFLSRRASRRIQRMVDSAREIGDGNAQHRMPVGDQTEFDFLSATINQTLDQLTKTSGELEAASAQLAKDKGLLEVTLRSIDDAIVTTDLDGRVQMINRVSEALTGHDSDTSYGARVEQVFRLSSPGGADVLSDCYDNIRQQKKAVVLPEGTLLKAESGQQHQVEGSVSPIIQRDGEIVGAVVALRDVTALRESQADQQKMQEILSHRNKMDAIGQLAGGVAHDFNNMLGGIFAAVDLLRAKSDKMDAKLHKYVDIIDKASTRSADLTAKLLAFGRKGKVMSSDVDIHPILDETIALLEKTPNKNVAINCRQLATNSVFSGDDSSIQNSLLNMGINAIHAMQDGGELTLETANVKLDPVFCATSPFDLTPGEFIEVTVRDTGCGIHPEIIDKVFEPFFTTREAGVGTGLGLASVYGTILDHHGAITVYSELGEGTVFRLYIPVSNDPVSTAERKPARVSRQHRRSVLLVDDEEIMLATGRGMLEEMGHEVVCATSASGALQVFRGDPARFDLVITDMIMPGVNGSELFYQLREIDPDCQVVLSSGFTRDEDVTDLKDDGLAAFVRKPFRFYELSETIERLFVTAADE